MNGQAPASAQGFPCVLWPQENLHQRFLDLFKDQNPSPFPGVVSPCLNRIFIAHLFGDSPEFSVKIVELVHKERVLVKNLPANSTEGSVRQLFQTYAALGGGGHGVSPLVEWLAWITQGFMGLPYGLEKPHWWSLINKLRSSFSIPPWEETVVVRTAMLNCIAYDMPFFWSGLVLLKIVLLNMYFIIFHSYVRIPWTNSKHFTFLHCERGFFNAFHRASVQNVLVDLLMKSCPSHTVFSSSRQWCLVPITTIAGIRMLPPVPGKHGLAAYITFKNLEEAEPKKTKLPKLAVRSVEVQHVVLGVGIVWNSRIKGNQCQICHFGCHFFGLPGQVGGGEHAQQSIERSSWTAVAWITDSWCSGVGEWWVLELKKLWLRCGFY